mmetsp:Transcript_13026/g.28143  ORF Transcript_13026/g.28143 Transcript_13026/m.28143 type:complete len:241 (+) Transcript_13026:1147-1869(+)
MLHVLIEVGARKGGGGHLCRPAVRALRRGLMRARAAARVWRRQRRPAVRRPVAIGAVGSGGGGLHALRARLDNLAEGALANRLAQLVQRAVDGVGVFWVSGRSRLAHRAVEAEQLERGARPRGLDRLVCRRRERLRQRHLQRLVAEPARVAPQRARLDEAQPADGRDLLHRVGHGAVELLVQVALELRKDERAAGEDARDKRVVAAQPVANRGNAIALAAKHLHERVAVAVLAVSVAVSP